MNIRWINETLPISTAMNIRNSLWTTVHHEFAEIYPSFHHQPCPTKAKTGRGTGEVGWMLSFPERCFAMADEVRAGFCAEKLWWFEWWMVIMVVNNGESHGESCCGLMGNFGEFHGEWWFMMVDFYGVNDGWINDMRLISSGVANGA